MTTQLLFTRDAGGYNTFIVTPSDSIQDTTLAANVAQTFTVPNDASKYAAIIVSNPGATIFVSLNDTAAVPGAAVAASTSMLNPPGIRVKAGDTISVITSDISAYVAVYFYSGIT